MKTETDVNDVNKVSDAYIQICFSVPDLEDDQADLVNGDAADQTTDGEELVRKPKKKK